MSKIGKISIVVLIVIAVASIAAYSFMFYKEAPPATLEPATTPAKPDITETTGSIVSPAPKVLFLHPGQVENFKYAGRIHGKGYNFSVKYLSAFPKHVLEVVVEEDIKNIEITRTDSCRGHCQYNWKNKNLTFIIEPINWKEEKWEEKNWTGKVMYFESWNTTELYFKID